MSDKQQRIERCCKCDEPTGRAGIHDDSLYLDDGSGPYCEECYQPEPMTDKQRCGGTGKIKKIRLGMAFAPYCSEPCPGCPECPPEDCPACNIGNPEPCKICGGRQPAIREALEGLEAAVSEILEDWGALTGHDILHLWGPCTLTYLSTVREALKPKPVTGEIGEALDGVREFLGRCRNLFGEVGESSSVAHLKSTEAYLSTVREWVNGQADFWEAYDREKKIAKQDAEIVRLRDRLGEVEYLEQLAGDLQKICGEKDAEIAAQRETDYYTGTEAGIDAAQILIPPEEHEALKRERDQLRGEVERWKEEADEQESSADELATEADKLIDERDSLRSALEEAWNGYQSLRHDPAWDGRIPEFARAWADGIINTIKYLLADPGAKVQRQESEFWESLPALSRDNREPETPEPEPADDVPSPSKVKEWADGLFPRPDCTGKEGGGG